MRRDGDAFTFSVADVRVKCSFEAGLSLAARSFVDRIDAEPHPPEGSFLAVDVIRGSAVPPRDLPLTCAFGNVEGYSAPGLLELWDGHSRVTARLDGFDVRGHLGTESDPHVVGAVMLFVATAVALRAHGLFHLHAACVYVPRLGTVLIVGESGSGKTTLSIALSILGGALVTDDAVFLRRTSSGEIEAHGWPGDLHVAGPTLDAFPALRAQAVRDVSDGRDKRVVPAAALGAPPTSQARNPVLVLFPRVAHQPVSTLLPLDSAGTVAGLIEQSGLALIVGAARCEEHLQLLAALATRTRGFRIELGADVLDPTTGLLDFLADALAAAGDEADLCS